MIYSLISDIIAFLHAALAALIFYPLLCLVCGSKVPLWLAVFCLIGASASVISYVVLHDCFINPLQKYFKKLAREEIYQGSFIAHYFNKLTGAKISQRFLFWMIIMCGIAGGIFIVQHFLER